MLDPANGVPAALCTSRDPEDWPKQRIDEIEP